MPKKEDTKSRIVKRTYEERHKEERKAKCMVWGTSINREYAEEINSFLKQHRITKVELIAAGYETLLNKYGHKKLE